MEKLKLPDSVFLQGDDRSSVLKIQKTQKLGKLKHPLLIFSNIKTHPGLYHVKEHAQGFPKLYNIWGWR